jgi:hypothetical protein
MKMIVCTSICANYIPKARVLASSFKKHNPGTKFILCLVEKTTHQAANDTADFDLVIKGSELGIDSFESFIFKHSIVEASTAVKGHLFLELLRRFPNEEKFVYLDPDILVTGEFVELCEALKDYDIVLTPHLAEPEEEYEAILDNEICSLKHGVFNLGFLAVRRSEQAKKFMHWWASRLYDFCYADIPGGLFTDQRWIDLAPCFFDVLSFRHPGYNIAPWNVSRRELTIGKNGEYLVNGQPLRFFHFSGFDSGANEAMIRKYCPDEKGPIYQLREHYVRLCHESGQRELGTLLWSYDFYSNGEEIPQEHRLLYRADRKLQLSFPEPFDAEANPSYYRYSKGNRTLRMFRDKGPCIKGHSLYKTTLDAYQTGGAKLVVEKALKYLKARA